MRDIKQKKFKIVDNRESGDTVLRQTQLVELKMLKQFHNICQKHRLNYWLDSGTLLGAVRHGGFIPWDDDIDVVMPMKDYKRIINLPKNEIPHDIFLKTRHTDPKTVHCVTKLMDKYSTYICYSNAAIDAHKGIVIDIFPFISYPGLSDRLIHYIVNISSWRIAYAIKMHKITLKGIGFFIKTLIESKILITIFYLLRFLFPSDKIGNKLEENTYKITHSKKSIYPLKKIKFEDGYFWSPNNHDTYLTVLYGDYMKLPPEDEQQGHHAILIKPFEKCNHAETLDWSKRANNPF